MFQNSGLYILGATFVIFETEKQRAPSTKLYGFLVTCEEELIVADIQPQNRRIAVQIKVLT